MLALDEFGDVLRDVAATSEPHRLCNYLFDTAKAFTDFYENCPVLPAPDEACGRTGWRCAGSPRRRCATGSGCWASRRRSACRTLTDP